MLARCLSVSARAAVPRVTPQLVRATMLQTARPIAVQTRSIVSTMPMRGDELAEAAADATYISKDAAAARVMDVLKDFGKVDPAKVTDSSNFVEDLGLDSLDTVELVMAFEEEFMVELDDADAEKIHTVPDAISFFSTHPMAK